MLMKPAINKLIFNLDTN